MSENILTKLQNGVLHIILNRPKKKNALKRSMYAGMADALEKGEKNPAVRVFLIYGQGDSFCAGNDLKDFQNPLPAGQRNSSGDFVKNILNAKKPIIAAVHGYAIGIGVTMLFHCDIIYASENAKLRLPFVNLGLTPELGSSYMLPRLAGHHRASEILFFSEFFTAKEANEIGLINKIFRDENLFQNATSLAEKLAKMPPASLRSTKALIKKQSGKPLADFMPEEGLEFARRLGSGEAQEAFKAFFEKRKPDFSKFS
jgi:enoyl-CoA hydratase/carnithine racemase